LTIRYRDGGLAIDGFWIFRDAEADAAVTLAFNRRRQDDPTHRRGRAPGAFARNRNREVAGATGRAELR
jgi:hypothetical protein